VKLTAIRLRCCVAPPQHALSSSNVNDTFAAPEYAIESHGGAWLRITHLESGKSRNYPIALCMGADEAAAEQGLRPAQGGQQQRHGGNRR
jgi:hypothetical protein